MSLRKKSLEMISLEEKHLVTMISLTLNLKESLLMLTLKYLLYWVKIEWGPE